MSGSNGSTRSTLVTPAIAGGPASTRGVLAGVLVLLLSVGWVANHFVALMPVLSVRQQLSPATLDVIFGVYALGLLPGLLVGGRASDAFGRRSVALAGSATAVAGTIAMLCSQQYDALLIGRLIVGLGVGLAMSSCTAWASDLNGPAGAAAAGAALMAGFAIGPFAGAVIAAAGPAGIRLSFGIAAAVGVAAMSVVVVTARHSGAAARSTTEVWEPPTPAEQGVAPALSWAMPLAPWVFASATLGFIAIPGRVHTGLAAPLAAGTATLMVNGVSGLIQVLARARRWGPQAGTAGAALAALGYAVTALAPPAIPLALGVPLFVMLGCASGLCLREGLIDLEAAAPKRLRGGLVGAFYVVTYIGFGLPLILATVGRTVSTAILAVMAALALLTAVSRAVRLRRDAHRQG
ncbi:transporter, major facilitator family protein [Mycobacterium europaeum]|uniref:Transporter, major facilitator family protein n=1 Tax=Mycobacterium europaeum TaxID=761804 RepID=A0A0U1D1R4_9MYCO|nr:MFS transporter [Mycobacterium europaeum]CQD06485.1 transporter, major facilitator family protein [Mycobacterium europaeum]